MLISFNGISQKKLTDTTFVIGYMNTGEFATKSLSDAGLKTGQEKMIGKNSAVFIISARQRSQSFQYYEVAYEGESYFVYREHVTLSENSDFEFNDFLNADKRIIDSIRPRAIAISFKLYQQKLSNALKFINYCKKVGLLIIDKSIYDESEYTEGTSFKCEVLNLSTKTIKYITFNVQGYNAVDDKVSSLKPLKGIGPIAKNQTSKYVFDYVWLTDIVETFKLVSIKVQYTDGSIKSFTDINSIYDSNEYLDLILGNETL
jgi:hypothetical protein